MTATPTLGEQAYAAYGRTTDHLNYQGLPMPAWTELVDDLGQQAYRAEDRLAFVREMCDQADRNGKQVTTEQVRAWTQYNGCGGVLRLPEEVMPLLRNLAASEGVATPATQASEPEGEQ